MPATKPRSVSSALLDNINSFGAQGVKFAGNFSSSNPDASFRLDGHLEGGIEFTAGGVVHIGANATLESGVVIADVIYVEGRVNGTLHARKVIEIAPSAVVMGTVRYDGELDIHKNARFRGALEFTGDMASEQTPAASPVADATPSVPVAHDVASTSTTLPSVSSIAQQWATNAEAGHVGDSNQLAEATALDDAPHA